jgi:cysteinyl-tRNA synthetase
MDDDLGVSGALAVIHEAVRTGNTALDDGDHEDAAAVARVVIAMTDVLGVNPLDPAWSAGDSSAADAEREP